MIKYKIFHFIICLILASTISAFADITLKVYAKPETKEFPEGYEIISTPSETASLIKTMASGSATIAGYADVNGKRYFISDWSYERYKTGQSHNWISPNSASLPKTDTKTASTFESWQLTPLLVPVEKSFPNGYDVISEPSNTAQAIKQMPQGTASVAAYAKIDGHTYWLSDWSYERYKNKQAYNWMREILPQTSSVPSSEGTSAPPTWDDVHMVAKLFHDEVRDSAPRRQALARAIDNPELSDEVRLEKKKELDELIKGLAQKQERVNAEVKRLSDIITDSERSSEDKQSEIAESDNQEAGDSVSMPAPVTTPSSDTKQLVTKGYSEVHVTVDSDINTSKDFLWTLISSPELKNVYLIVSIPTGDYGKCSRKEYFTSLSSSPAMPKTLPNLLVHHKLLTIDPAKWTVATTTDFMLIRQDLLKSSKVGRRTLDYPDARYIDNGRLISDPISFFDEKGSQSIFARDGAFDGTEDYIVPSINNRGVKYDHLSRTALFEGIRDFWGDRFRNLPHYIRSIKDGNWLDVDWSAFHTRNWADPDHFDGELRSTSAISIVFKCPKDAMGDGIVNLFRDLDLVELAELERKTELDTSQFDNAPKLYYWKRERK